MLRTTTPWQRRARRAAADLALLAFALGVSLLLAEGLVRLAAPQPLAVRHPELWRADAAVGYAHQPNVRLRMNTGERDVTVVTDSDGHRVGLAGRPEADTRILVLGDSFMEALQVEYEQSLSGLLEERLPSVLGRPVAVVDTGMSGWQPSRYLAQARVELARRSYDLVLVSIFLGNDIEEQRLADLHQGVAEGGVNALPGADRSWLFERVVLPANQFLREHSQLFVLLKDRSRPLLTRLGLREIDLPPYFRRGDEASPRWEVTAGICRDIADEAGKRGAPTLFLLIPADFQVHTDEFFDYVQGAGIDAQAYDLDQPARLLGEALRAQGLDVVDLVPALRAAHGRGIRSFGKADRHLSPAGHDVIERAIEPLVLGALQGADAAGRSRHASNLAAAPER